MIPPPPGPGAIITGLAYGLRLASPIATRRGTPQEMPPSTKAICDALWFRYMLVLLNGWVALDFGHLGAIFMLAALGLVDVLLYPVASHLTLRRMRLDRHFPQFILAVTWVGNLRVLILMIVLLMAASTAAPAISFMMIPFALWMIWVTWSAATQSIANRGWVGAGMVVVMMLIEMVNAVLIITFLHPLLAQG